VPKKSQSADTNFSPQGQNTGTDTKEPIQSPGQNDDGKDLKTPPEPVDKKTDDAPPDPAPAPDEKPGSKLPEGPAINANGQSAMIFTPGLRMLLHKSAPSAQYGTPGQQKKVGYYKATIVDKNDNIVDEVPNILIYDSPEQNTNEK